ncbi:hypothetical protein [Candidatus Lokiarchaeum ossiferum]|uniref:hypothetical protein n=1 Tax=Candidatus Lokiarchaeum ossiferum TaxID=2951803 RepID=UPI00352BEC09
MRYEKNHNSIMVIKHETNPKENPSAKFIRKIQENLGEKYIEIATARINHFENYLKSIGKSFPTLDNKDILLYTRPIFWVGPWLSRE